MYLEDRTVRLQLWDTAGQVCQSQPVPCGANVAAEITGAEL